MATGFTTIGHSSRNLDDFLDMLRAAQVDLLIDVRSFPRSRTNPVFNADRLPAELFPLQIAYRHVPALGGRRPRQRGIEENLNSMWRVQSFHNYAGYALGQDFGVAFDDVVSLGCDHRLA